MTQNPQISLETRRTYTATTDATPSIMEKIEIPDGSMYLIDVTVAAQRSGGAAGTPGDGAGYHVFATFKNVAGLLTQIGVTSKIQSEDQVAWDVDFNINAQAAELYVQGAADNNVDWVSITSITKIS